MLAILKYVKDFYKIFLEKNEDTIGQLTGILMTAIKMYNLNVNMNYKVPRHLLYMQQGLAL